MCHLPDSLEWVQGMRGTDTIEASTSKMPCPRMGSESVMPRMLPLAAAQPKLAEIVAGMIPGEALVLTSDGEPLAVITRSPRTSWPSEPRAAKDRSFWVAPDFDAPLEDFAEYMERSLPWTSMQ